MVLRKLNICKAMELNPYLTLNTEINSKWIKDLNLIAKTIKPLEDIGQIFMPVALHWLLGYDTKAQAPKGWSNLSIRLYQTGKLKCIKGH